MSEVIGRCVTGLLLTLIFQRISSELVYVQTGSNINGCNMTCPGPAGVVGVMELYRQCGGEDFTLLELHCQRLNIYRNIDGIHLEKSSGCWELAHARKEESCLYNIRYQGEKGYPVSSTDIRVLDPVVISNMTSNSSELGEDTAVSVQFSGEESAVTWELDGEPLPERYRLIDDNRTLIIPNVQREDAQRRFQVRITNPVSEEIQEYQLKIRDSDFLQSWGPIIGLVGIPGILTLLIYITFIFERRAQRREKSKVIWEIVPLNDMKIEYVPTMENRSVPTMENRAVHSMNIWRMDLCCN